MSLDTIFEGSNLKKGYTDMQVADRNGRHAKKKDEVVREPRKKVVELVWNFHTKTVEPRVFPTTVAARRELESYCPDWATSFLKGDDYVPGDQCPNCHGLFELQAYQVAK